MIFLGNIEKISDAKYRVGYIHYQPFDSINGLNKTEKELKQSGVLISSNSFPVDEGEGKISTLFVNPNTGEAWYEYVEAPNVPEESQGQAQQEKIQELENALLEMSTIQAVKDTENEQAIMELTNLIGGMM